MVEHINISDIELRSLIRQGALEIGGYRPNKIYGLLSCTSGKRMKRQNRVFFKNEQEAIDMGYRPCGHCMKEQYQIWKTAMNI